MHDGGMDQELEDIPQELVGLAKSAVQWLNAETTQAFELTGVVDYEDAMKSGLQEPFELGLVLCDGEICQREQVRFEPRADGFDFSLGQSTQREVPSLLDPPPGVRSDWLRRALEKYEFVVLLFYRGLW